MNSVEDVHEVYLQRSELLDVDSRLIREFAQRVAVNAKSDREKAVLIHDAVRDEVTFGFTGGFYDEKASETLKNRRGFCITKAALFTSALRSSGIPARMVFVDISSDILRGVLNTGTQYVEHAYTEVLLDEMWIKTDSYTVDQLMFTKAQQALQEEGSVIGYGVHRSGTIRWDGTKDAFSQFLDNGEMTTLTTTRYGVFADARALYRSDNKFWNKKTLVLALLFPFFARLSINPAIDKVRSAGRA
ncbi:hypothetical protein NDN08_008256 [Rhodosorus marinus]|uniref:Transglutaminase-like domain-containing protein n=1 Tax=Rhodosorus marinus TaxID=101924 RepID=A0AAV8V3C3_9RHOD|nr:hypothetical protein NDN08_008256 [Rhodosorus marinus]